MNYKFFYIKDTEIKVLDQLKIKNSYYSNFYLFFSQQKKEDSYISDLKSFFTDTGKDYIRKMALKILKNTYESHFREFDVIFDENCNINKEVYFINMKDFDSVSNKELIIIYNKLIDDLDLLCKYYMKYYQKIFKNFNISLNPIEVIIENKEKILIEEGTHRFIFCYIYKLNPIFIIKKSNCEIYNKISVILKQDYETMYKSNNPDEFVIYNKIPHILFENIKFLREDRSDVIINYLENKNYSTGLEIGPQNGLLSVQLAKSGYKVDCVEYDKKYFDLTNLVIELCDQQNKINTIFTNIYNYNVPKFGYDFIVSLSVFYHLKRNDKEKFETLFQELLSKTKILIFDDEPNTGIFTQEDILNYISGLEVTIETIHVGSDNRKIYAIVNNH